MNTLKSSITWILESSSYHISGLIESRNFLNGYTNGSKDTTHYMQKNGFSIANITLVFNII